MTRNPHRLFLANLLSLTALAPSALSSDARKATLPAVLSDVEWIREHREHLWIREQARKDGVSWNRLRRAAREEWLGTHPAFARELRITRLVAQANAGAYGSAQTAAANRLLARLVLGERDAACAAVIIEGETAHTWDHRIEYGSQYGTHLIYSGEAYGLGQALPGTKMLRYGADAASNPRTQLVWFRAYAEARYGSVCAASTWWTPRRSW